MKLKILHQETYLAMIKDSVGTNIFRSLFVLDEETGQKIDITEDGTYSCARFVTAILTIAGRIDRPHATVKTTQEIFTNSPNWVKVQQPIAGDVVFYHEHVGFVIDNQHCISNSPEKRQPIKHPMTMEDGRQPLTFWRFQETSPEVQEK